MHITRTAVKNVVGGSGEYLSGSRHCQAVNCREYVNDAVICIKGSYFTD
jgi:hypothetical protein